MPGLIARIDDIADALGATATRLHAMAQHRAQLDTAFGNIEGAVALWDGEERLVMANRRLHELFGLPPEAIVAGMRFRTFIDLAIEHGHLEGPGPEDVYTRRCALVRRGKALTFDIALTSGRVVQVSYHPQESGGWLATYEDVTERQRAQAQVAFLAHHDPLTRLANRVLFHLKLGEVLARVGDVAVLYLDLDRFKEVNDTLGHTIGDTLLRFAATRLGNCFRQSDTVARLGGDEFAVILSPGTRDVAVAAAQHAIDILGRPFDVEGHEITVGTSIGIAVAPQQGKDSETLLRHADMALYAAKADGRGTFCVFEQIMNDRLLARHALEGDLRTAIAKNELRLFYQPLVNTRTGIVSGFEALMRWHHPQRGLIAPADFIPVAEATRLIVPLGTWSIRQACIDLARLPTHLRMAVNLSPVQFRNKELVRTVRDALTASGIPAGRLELEVTESTLMKDVDSAVAILDELRSLGVRIAMDDFGTGYSSLSYLRHFPFDKIKIDKSFVDDIGQRRGADAIIRAVTGIADSLGIETVAEGVESPEQYQRVVQEGCDQVQGYLFSRAVGVAALPDVIRRIDGNGVSGRHGRPRHDGPPFPSGVLRQKP
ncbi:MAG: EAL domain-containing protein [Acetobacteraceae bacterium]|nr:EAL domain-containing protein [Acetobacteraceae bacterium]